MERAGLIFSMGKITKNTYYSVTLYLVMINGVKTISIHEFNEGFVSKFREVS